MEGVWRQGFSLVELSIVLVILGLLVGGVLTGQSLIRAAELRSITTDFEKYQTAIKTFRDKYLATPGDMTNATSFWGTMTNCGVAGPSGTGTQTCNGDGDGSIGAAAAASQTGEVYLFWQHLANAGLIEGTYTGIAGSAAVTHHVLGQNAPKAKLGNAGWYTQFPGAAATGSTQAYFLNYGNYLEIGASTNSAQPIGRILTPEEAWNIDTKMDDGKPGKGAVVARYWNDICSVADDGASANNDYEASYKLSDTSAQCTLIFRQVY